MDTLGNRMKGYEQRLSERCLPYLPVCARLDGKAFHSWTSGLNRPFDERLHNLFVDTTRFLVEETGARIGYTQSDEITLIWYSDNIDTQIFFDGKVQKMISVLASMTTGYFNAFAKEYLKGFPIPELAFFDCRVWQVPTLEEAANVLVWRELDARRNSIQMAAQSVYSHKALFKKNQNDLQEMLFQKGINWNDYPSWAKKGTYVQRREVMRALTEAELERIPPKHRPKETVVKRMEVTKRDLPPITKIRNRTGVYIYGEEPVVLEVA